jgi:hypothetical protein
MVKESLSLTLRRVVGPVVDEGTEARRDAVDGRAAAFDLFQGYPCALQSLRSCVGSLNLTLRVARNGLHVFNGEQDVGADRLQIGHEGA